MSDLRRKTGCGMMKIPAFWSLGTLFAVYFIGAGSLQDVKLVFPPVVRLGGEATLLCLYDLEGQPLYSVQWYRGNHEFYRYMPKESPPGRAFPFVGIVVEMSSSNANQVSLKHVPLHLSGKFRCEVSTDSPFFTTKYSEDELTVLDFPDSRPVMTLVSMRYRMGELLTVNCTSQPSPSPPTLTFYVNNRAVPPDVVTVWVGGAMLRAQLKMSDFSPRGELRLKCVASVMGLYNISSGSVAIRLEQGKSPRPGDEDTTSTGSKHSIDTAVILVAMMLWKYSVHSVQSADA